MKFLILLLFSINAFAVHTFDDLNPEEVKTVVSIIKESKKFGDDIRFPIVRRQDPPKKDWLDGKAKDFRQAYVAVFDKKKALTIEVIVDLKSRKILSIKDLPGITPPLMLEEYNKAREIVKADPAWQKAIRARGIENLDDVWVDSWAPGLQSKEEQKPGQRILRGLAYKKGDSKNYYSRPIEGIIATVDLNKNKVISIWDVEKVPVAEGTRELTGKTGAHLLKPLVITQPKGPSYSINGQEISWYRWKFRWSMDTMQGLQIYHVRFNEKGQDRSIVYKLALSEMLVPYSAPEKTWSFRNAFDVGEYALGKTLHPLEKGVDVPEHATLLNIFSPDDVGTETFTLPGAAVYERDGGLMWKHRDSETGEAFSDRARQLVITFFTTIGNYDYGINYIFHMDGVLQVEAQLTGILLARGTALAKNECKDSCRPLTEKNVLAPYHQHFFNFRIDLDVDGPANNAAEVNVKALPQGKNNPDGNVFVSETTALKKEKSSVRDFNMQSARKWKVVNFSSRNEFGHPRSYALMTGENIVPYLQPTNQIRQRARFIEHPIWFTKYNDNEQSAAAPYPTTAPKEQGLPKFISNNESLEDQDLVLWYTFGTTHLPKPEEWPVMNVHRTGFSLMPVNFFSENASF